MNELEQLSQRIRNNPDDLEAWKGLLTLVGDPDKKRDCQEQIDRILAKHSAAPMLCPQCGGGMSVYFAGELHDKRTKCPFCGTEIEIPDTYSKISVETHTDSGQFLPGANVTVIERRADNSRAAITSDEIDQIIMDKGLAAARQELETRGLQELKIDGVARMDKSSEAYRILEEQGLKSLGKSQGAIFVTPRQVSSLFKGVTIFFMIMALITVAILLVQFLK